jgi:two-component system, response regulator PdtaR
MTASPLRVLIVEDEALILMQLESLVEDAGHRVVGTAMRCVEAIDLARELRPDLAFVDLSLSDHDSGLDVAQALHETAGAMVVFVTANPLRLGEDLAGAAGVIAKPFTRSVIASGMPYLEECIRHPPPIRLLPGGMRMASRYIGH